MTINWAGGQQIRHEVTRPVEPAEVALYRVVHRA